MAVQTQLLKKEDKFVLKKHDKISADRILELNDSEPAPLLKQLQLRVTPFRRLVVVGCQGFGAVLFRGGSGNFSSAPAPTPED